MQNELISSVNGDPFRSTRDEPKEEQPPLSSIHLPSNSGDLFYSSTSSLSLPRFPVSANGGDDLAATEIDLYLARLAFQYQYREMVHSDRFERCLSYLQEVTEQEEHSDLTSCLAIHLRPETSLTSVLLLQPLNENQMLHHAAERRGVLLKSTSIRSSEYLKMNQPESQGPAIHLNDMTRSTRPVISTQGLLYRDKWRNTNVMASGSESREKMKVSNRKSHLNPKHEDGDNIDDKAISMELAAYMDDDIVDVMLLMSYEPSQIAPDVIIYISRLDHFIMKAIRTLNEPRSSQKAAIADYIEVKCKRSPKMLLLEGVGCQREEQPSGLDKEVVRIKVLTRDELNTELLEMWRMDKEAAEALAVSAMAEEMILLANNSSPSSLLLPQSPVSTNGGNDPAATEIHLYLARLAFQYQYREMVHSDRFERCLSYLQEGTEQEEHSDLTSRLAMHLRTETSLTSVLLLQPLNENQMLHHAAERRGVLPKSTSIRSSGYLKMNQPESQGPAIHLNDMTRSTRPVILESDKWRDINGMASGSESREKVKASNRKSRPNPKHEDGDNIDDMAISMELSAYMDDDIVDVMLLMSYEPSQIATDVKIYFFRLDHFIMKAIRTLNEPRSSQKAAIADYIEVKRKRSPKMLLLEGVGCQREEQPSGLDNEEFRIKVLTTDELDAELLEMWRMDKEAAKALAVSAMSEQMILLANNSSPSLSLFPSPVSTNGGDDPAATEIRLYLARLAFQYQYREMVHSDRFERCLSYLQEATEQEAHSDLTSRLAMQLRAETSLTSVLPLQPLNENQLLHHAAERQAVPAPKGLARQFNDVTSSIRPGPTSRKNRVATGAIVIFVILLCISEAKATLSFDAPPHDQPKSNRQVCSFPSWRDRLNNTGVDVACYLLLLGSYLLSWLIVMCYEVKDKGQSWMYLGCLILSCIPLILISFEEDYKELDIIKIWTGVGASICTLSLDIARYPHFGHHRVAAYIIFGSIFGGAAVQILGIRADIAQFVDVGINLISTLILIFFLLWIERWEYTTAEVWYALLAAVCVLPNLKTCQLQITVLTLVAFIARILYGVLLFYRSNTAGRAATSWEPVWQEMKTWPSQVWEWPSNCCLILYLCYVVEVDYLWPNIKELCYELIWPKIKKLPSKFCKFATWIWKWLKPDVDETQREIELTPLRVRQP